MASSEEAPREGTVSRVLRLLMIVGEAGGPIGIHQTAQLSNLPVSTVHRLVNLMVDAGFVTYDGLDRMYLPGPQLHRLAALVWQSSPAGVAEPVLQELADTYDETILFNLYLPDQLKLTTIAKQDGSRALRYHFEMNATTDLAWGASGKCILAHLSEDEARRAYADAEAIPGHRPLPPIDEFLRQLADIREAGYAASSGERIEGAQSVAAAVFGVGGAVLGGLCFTFPHGTKSASVLEEMVDAIRAAARSLSLELGAPPAMGALQVADGPRQG